MSSFSLRIETWPIERLIPYARNARTHAAKAGGVAQPILDLRPMFPGPVWPQVLPGGKYVIYTVFGVAGPDRGAIEVLSLADRKRRVLVRGGTFGRYLPGGYLTYVNQSTLYAIPFDPDRAVVSGAAIPVLNDVSYSTTFGYAQVDISATGTLVYRRSAANGRFVVQWLDREKAATELLSKPALPSGTAAATKTAAAISWSSKNTSMLVESRPALAEEEAATAC